MSDLEKQIIELQKEKAQLIKERDELYSNSINSADSEKTAKEKYDALKKQFDDLNTMFRNSVIEGIKKFDKDFEDKGHSIDFLTGLKNGLESVGGNSGFSFTEIGKSKTNDQKEDPKKKLRRMF